MTYQVDIIRIGGDEGEQALVVNGVVVGTCPGDGEGAACIPDAEMFFVNLGCAIGAQFAVAVHTVDVEDLDLPPDEWVWEDVVARSAGVRALRNLKQGNEWERAVQAIVEHRNAWTDGYTPGDADAVLEAINALVAAAGLPGKMWLLWEEYDEFGLGGDSDLYYVEGSGEETIVAQAGEVYGLVDGEGDPRPFVEWLDGLRRHAGAGFTCAPHFPSLQVSQYQGVDTRGAAGQPACCLRCSKPATWLVNFNVYCDGHAGTAAEETLAQEPAVSRYHHSAGFNRVGHDYVAL